jgi:hypothetical protein
MCLRCPRVHFMCHALRPPSLRVSSFTPVRAVLQCAPAVDLHAVRPVAAMACEPGMGLAVCPALHLIVTSSLADSTISAYALAGPDHRLLGTWGGNAPDSLEFDFDSGDDSGGLCFTVAATAAATPQLLVASSGARRVVVLDVADVVRGKAPRQVNCFETNPSPRCVAACAGLVAVSGWTKKFVGDHTVTLYAAEAGAWARVRVVGVGRGRGDGDGQLDAPIGLRFSADGARLLVADRGNDRVCCFRVADGAFEREVASRGAHGLSGPCDVAEVAGGVLVADTGNHRVVRVPADGSPATVLGGVKGSRPGQFKCPAALFVSANGTQVVVRERDGCRFQVFGVRMTVCPEQCARHVYFLNDCCWKKPCRLRERWPRLHARCLVALMSL